MNRYDYETCYKKKNKYKNNPKISTTCMRS